jgi:hypothetical protein
MRLGLSRSGNAPKHIRYIGLVGKAAFHRYAAIQASEQTEFPFSQNRLRL